MKYNQPVGEAADAPFVDGNKSAGIKGSRLPAAFPNQVQQELIYLITSAGLSPDAANLQQVREAIDTIITAAIAGVGGEGDPIDTSLFYQLADARNLQPFYPEIKTADGKIALSVPSTGTIRIPAGTKIVHRGAKEITAAETDLSVTANKTFHVRWTKADGFVIKDLVDGAYNPGGVAESSTIFDSTFDSALLARVVTDSGNNATITPLVNKHEITLQSIIKGINVRKRSNNGSSWDIRQTIDFSRKPSLWHLSLMKAVATGQNGDKDFNIAAPGSTDSQLQDNDPSWSIDRYGIDQRVMYDDNSDIFMQFSARA